MIKTTIGLIAAIIVIGGGYYLYSSPTAQSQAAPQEAGVIAGAQAVAAGTYRVDPAQSTFSWSGKKPRIEGYVNSGTIAIKEGTITADANAPRGSFTLDMNSLDVGLTAKKPGQEGALEQHLKGERFFDAAKFPTAAFVITSVVPLDEAAHRYTVTGDLTMKGITNAITFPASIYVADDVLYAEAQTEIDRTQWGITMGSGNFFENLGDNLIDDMVAISFKIAAPRAQ